MTTISELIESIAPLGGAIVAFSGGVDSTLVAALADRALGERALAVTAVSPSLAGGELSAAREIARGLGIRHLTLVTAELDRPGYRANGPDRCYHCKAELYERLAELARAEGAGAVLSGTNADDLGDWRPGLRAAAEHGVRHPLVQAGVGKAQVRELARQLGLANWDKPAAPCLSSRVPHGTPVESEVLARIDQAERALKQLGYRALRVRHFGDRARVELGADELPTALAHSQELIAAVQAAGYRAVRIDSRPLRSGSLTAHLVTPERNPR